MSLIAMVLALASSLSAQATTPAPTTTPDTYTYSVPPFSGAGPCSSGNVTSLNIRVQSTAPGLSAVLTGSLDMYNAFLTANISDPSSNSLPPPLVDLSCVNPDTAECDKLFPAGRSLKPMVMCILAKNELNITVNVTVTVDWGYVAGAAGISMGNGTGTNLTVANSSTNGNGTISGATKEGITWTMMVTMVAGGLMSWI